MYIYGVICRIFFVVDVIVEKYLTTKSYREVCIKEKRNCLVDYSLSVSTSVCVWERESASLSLSFSLHPSFFCMRGCLSLSVCLSESLSLSLHICVASYRKKWKIHRSSKNYMFIIGRQIVLFGFIDWKILTICVGKWRDKRCISAVDLMAHVQGTWWSS